jgi:hypothetical protein
VSETEFQRLIKLLQEIARQQKEIIMALTIVGQVCQAALTVATSTPPSVTLPPAPFATATADDAAAFAALQANPAIAAALAAQVAGTTGPVTTNT